MTETFLIIDKTTGQPLANLPMTISIGDTLDGFKQAGYKVFWTWGDQEPQYCPSCGGVGCCLS